MINLLPPKEKQLLLLEKKKNILLIWSLMVLVAIICMILLLFALKFYILGEISAREFDLRQAEENYQTPGFTEYKKQVQAYNKTLNRISSFYEKELYFGECVDVIFSVERPEGIYFNNVLFERLAQDRIKVSIFGASRTRENLLSFKGNLEKESALEKVYFSPDSWISPQNVNFTVTFEFFQ